MSRRRSLESAQASRRGRARGSPTEDRVLVVDIGGSNVKLLCSGSTRPRRFASGSTLTPPDMIKELKAVCRGWNYDRVSIGYPSRVGPEGSAIRTVIARSGLGWFRIATALGKPVRIINHAAMQALGSYDGGRSASATTSQCVARCSATMQVRLRMICMRSRARERERAKRDVCSRGCAADDGGSSTRRHI
jgi:hypothetical protein